MKKAVGALVMVTGLVVVAGCARSERWTLDGSKPGPLDDRKDFRPEIRMPESAKNAAPTANVELVTDNDYAVVRNNGDVQAVATVQVTTGEKSTAHDIQVLVPAKSDVRLGRTNGTGADASSYRIVGAESR